MKKQCRPPSGEEEKREKPKPKELGSKPGI
jgi:hypothetical protein